MSVNGAKKEVNKFFLPYKLTVREIFHISCGISTAKLP